MFTGLIEEIGQVLSIRREPGGKRLRIRAARVITGLRPGDSLAVNGVCQTVVSLPGAGSLEVLAVGETLRRTTVDQLRAGSRVNLETALRLGDPLGGHWVNGHIDATGRIEEVSLRGDDHSFRISLPPALAPYVVEKGSIAVDGVSLTVGRVSGGRFEVHIIPETREKTLFGFYRPGDEVNLEADILAKYIEHAMGREAESRESAAAGLLPGGWRSDRARRIVEAWSEERGDETRT